MVIISTESAEDQEFMEAVTKQLSELLIHEEKAIRKIPWRDHHLPIASLTKFAEILEGQFK